MILHDTVAEMVMHTGYRGLSGSIPVNLGGLWFNPTFKTLVSHAGSSPARITFNAEAGQTEVRGSDKSLVEKHGPCRLCKGKGCVRCQNTGADDGVMYDATPCGRSSAQGMVDGGVGATHPCDFINAKLSEDSEKRMVVGDDPTGRRHGRVFRGRFAEMQAQDYANELRLAGYENVKVINKNVSEDSL
jgi:hypothetical protein